MAARQATRGDVEHTTIRNNLAHIKNILGHLRHFAELPEEIQQMIAASAVHRHFNAGQVIYMEGEPAESIYILESGWVKAACMTREGREQATMFLHPVEVFGDIAVLTGTTYPGTVVALEDVDMCIVPAQVILDLIPRHSELARAVIRHLGERVLHYIHLVEDLSLPPLPSDESLRSAPGCGESIIMVPFRLHVFP